MAPRWRLFAVGTLLLLGGLLVLARQTTRMIRAETRDTDRDDPVELAGRAGESAMLDDAPNRLGRTIDILASAAFSQLVIVVSLGVLVWSTEVPLDALGLEADRGALLLGPGIGIGLVIASESTVSLVRRAGLEVDETLRELLSPDTKLDWVVLLFVVLPAVAVGEELLFRGALIGGLSTGFDVSPWVLAVLSSAAFGLGHDLQGLGGVVVTTGLGAALATAFVLTDSLLLVIGAHYIVNVSEFVIHDGISPAVEQ